MRVAQLILERIVTDEVVQVERLPAGSGSAAARGSSGFGSTDRTYLSMNHSTEDEPISVTETTEGIGSGSATADHQVPTE